MHDLTGLIVAIIWTLGVCSFGVWVALSPERYWNMWKRWLEQNSGNRDSIYTMRYEQIEADVNTGNPRRKGQILGVCIVIIGVLVGIILGRISIFGPFSF